MKLGNERRLTHDEWTAWLSEPGRKLTLRELAVLELVNAHALQEQLTAGLGMHPTVVGGYLEQLRNLLDGVLRRAAGPLPKKALPEGGD
jgi:hypothetical protein